MTSRYPLFPVSLVVAGRACLVVGGGEVAARKAQALLDCGALVTVVAPEVVEAIRHMAGDPASPDDAGGSLSIEERPYRAGEAAAFRLVVTATGIPAVDHAVFTDAEAAGVWANSADDIENCAFLLPAVHRDGPVTVAVSTGGASPALAGWLRTRAAEAIGPDIPMLATLLSEARGSIKAAGVSTEGFDWATIIDDHVVPLVRAGRIREAKELLSSLSTA